MKKYYYNSPRGFSNEFSIISVDQWSVKEVAAFAEFEERYNNSSDTNWKLYRISAKEAKTIIAMDKKLKKDYIMAGLNLVENPVGATEVTTATDFFNL